MALFAVQLDYFSVQTALPSMAEDLGTSVTSLQWVLSGYMLALSALFVVGGRLGDIFGRRRLLVIGMSVFGAASLIGGAAQDPATLIVMRIVQGAGAAILFPTCVAAVATAVPPSRVHRALGLAFAVAAIGQGLGPVFGGVVTDLLSWRWVLWVNVPVAVVVIALALAVVADTRDESVPAVVDWAGLVLVIASVGTFTYGVDSAADAGWASPVTLGLIAAGIAVGAAAVATELRVRDPLLDLGLFRLRRFSVTIAAAAIANAGFGTVVILSMLLLQDVRGMSPLEAGLAFLPFAVGSAAAAIASGRLEWATPRSVMTVAVLLGGLGTIGMGVADSLAPTLAFSLPAGVGFGLSFSYAQIVTEAAVPRDRAGAASGILLTIVVGVGGLAVAAVASLLDTTATAGAYTESDLDVLFIGGGLVTLAAVPILALLGPERGESQQPEPVAEGAGAG